MAKKQRSHLVPIRIRFDAPVTAKEARYAAWNHFQDYEMFGDGKPCRGDDERDAEPYGQARVTVRR